jgi:hypothetical protein
VGEIELDDLIVENLFNYAPWVLGAENGYGALVVILSSLSHRGRVRVGERTVNCKQNLVVSTRVTIR